MRRIFAMRAAHAGWPVFGFPSSRILGDLVDCHRGAGLAEFAFPLAEPREQLPAGDADSDRDGLGDDRPPVLPQDDPAESCYQVGLPLRLRLASKQVLGPSPVSAFALWRAAILETVDWCFAASVFSIYVSAFQRSVRSRQASLASR